jgi:hypothetical protein
VAFLGATSAWRGVAGFLLVGYLASRHDVEGFDWELASIFGTALGTLLLALATGALALTTARDVSATQEIARLTRADREDRLRPVVIGTVTGAGADEEGVFISVELVNIGGGAAVRVDATAEHIHGDETPGTTSIAAIQAGQTIPLAVRLPHIEDDDWVFVRSDEFRARGRYLDRLARPVAQEIYDWRHDEPPTLAD